MSRTIVSVVTDYRANCHKCCPTLHEDFEERTCVVLRRLALLSDKVGGITEEKISGLILFFARFALPLQRKDKNIEKMRSRTSDWFETKIRYDKTQEDGTQKKVTEQYVVDALSFTEAESSIIEEMSSYISGDFKITDIKPAPYHEIFFSDMESDDKWFKTKLQFITIDEKTEKEKRSNVNYLVQAGTLEGAVKHIGEVMGTTMNDYAIASVAETMIMDVFEHNAQPKKEQPDDKPEYEEQPKAE